jgi:hypothetical protein
MRLLNNFFDARTLVRPLVSTCTTSAQGQKLPNSDVRVTSVHPSISDITLYRRERRNGSTTDLQGGSDDAVLQNIKYAANFGGTINLSLFSSSTPQSFGLGQWSLWDLLTRLESAVRSAPNSDRRDGKRGTGSARPTARPGLPAPARLGCASRVERTKRRNA